MAWVEPQPGGGFRGRYRTPGGEKRTVLQPDGTAWRRKKDAKDAATEEEVKARRKAPVKTKSTRYPATIEWREWWDVICARVEDRPTGTSEVEKSIARTHILPTWGNVPLLNIAKRANEHAGMIGIKEWISTDLKPRKGMSPSYACRIFSVFSSSLSAACDEEIIEFNPAIGLMPASPDVAKRPALEHAEVNDLKLRAEDEELAEFGSLTGLRPGELCGLHIHRYLPRRRCVVVADVLVERLKIIRKYPKDSDHRLVPLTPRAVEIIEGRIEGRGVGKCPIPHYHDEICLSPLVFMTRRNEPYKPANIRRVLKRAGIREGTEVVGGLYATRHGFGTSSANGGMNVFEVAEIMGHANLETTRGYFRATKDIRDRLTRALEGE